MSSITINVYDSNAKKVVSLNVSEENANDRETFNKTYPQYNSEDYYISILNLNNPIIDNGKIREMTREERIINGESSLLIDGEYLENGVIYFIEEPKGLLKKEWNKETHEWEDNTTYNDHMKFFDNAIESYTQSVISSKGYRDITRVNLWANFPTSPWKEEAEKILLWYGKVWKKCIEIQTEVVNGEREIPESIEELVKELPELE